MDHPGDVLPSVEQLDNLSRQELQGHFEKAGLGHIPRNASQGFFNGHLAWAKQALDAGHDPISLRRSLVKKANKQERCVIYTRKSSENGLEQSFNSLHAQREACEAYIKSQAHEGWSLRPTLYDDGGISGGHVARSALQALLEDIRRDLICNNQS